MVYLTTVKTRGTVSESDLNQAAVNNTIRSPQKKTHTHTLSDNTLRFETIKCIPCLIIQEAVRMYVLHRCREKSGPGRRPLSTRPLLIDGHVFDCNFRCVPFSSPGPEETSVFALGEVFKS
jgi:hypothetical protein